MSDKKMTFKQIDGGRRLRRSIKKANGEPLRTGPAKASDGSEKGPARIPSWIEVRRVQRAAQRKSAKEGSK